MRGILGGQNLFQWKNNTNWYWNAARVGFLTITGVLEHDIKPGTFYNWVKRLRKAGTYTIPDPVGRDTYTAMPRQDIVKVELVEESVKIPRQGYPAGSDTEHADRFHSSMELHIGSASVFVANDIDPVLLAQTIQMLKGAPPC